MKRLLTTLVILTGLLGSVGSVWADAWSDFNRGWEAYEAGDYAEAAKWYRKAADEGLAIAQFRLGSMYALGEGVSQDDAEAKKWFREAALRVMRRRRTILVRCTSTVETSLRTVGPSVRIMLKR
jgi:hypothetical protein